MNKKLLYSLMASLSMISVGAYAAPISDDSTAALTTKGYVDTGLKYVYDSIKGDVTNVEGDVTDLQTIVGHEADPEHEISASGLVKDVADLQNDVDGLADDVDDLQDAVGTAGQDNTPGTGLTGRVEALEDTITTLDSLGTDNLQANKKYILQTNAQGEGSWSEIEVESTWNATAFENNVLGGN